jgi:predicted cobalt transporter CbtA
MSPLSLTNAMTASLFFQPGKAQQRKRTMKKTIEQCAHDLHDALVGMSAMQLKPLIGIAATLDLLSAVDMRERTLNFSVAIDADGITINGLTVALDQPVEICKVRIERLPVGDHYRSVLN